MPRTWLIVGFPEVVDRQISGRNLWRSCYKNILCTSMKTLCKCLVEVILS